MDSGQGMTSDEVLSIVKSMRQSFQMTKQRCYNPKCRDYKYYGGRGITICSRWLESFDNFIDDMGLRPSGMTLERKDNDKEYGPDNCIWASRDQQMNNTRAVKRVTYEGVTRTVAEWERIKGFKPGTLKARLGPLGYTVEEAFSKPVVCGAKLEGKVYKPRKSPDMSGVPRGLDSSQIGLTKAQVLEARTLYKAGGESFSSLGLRFGVSVTTMSNAIQGLKAYANVEENISDQLQAAP